MKIKKREGDLQDFDRTKVYRSVLAAGASQEETNVITDQVQNWIESLNEEVISTETIKNKVIVLLEAQNPVVAQTYQNYKKY